MSPPKAFSPISSRVAGSTISCREMQKAKASGPIRRTPSGSTTRRTSLPWKAWAPTAVTRAPAGAVTVTSGSVPV